MWHKSKSEVRELNNERKNQHPSIYIKNFCICDLKMAATKMDELFDWTWFPGTLRE